MRHSDEDKTAEDPVSAVLALVGSGALHRLDRWVQDWMYQQGGVPSPDIVLIGIDEETLAELGPYGPGYRGIMAYALEKLAQDPEKRPAAVAIDVLYEGESGTAGDAQLAAAAEKLGCVVTASMAEYGEVITWEDGHAVERNASAVVNYVEPYDALRSVTVQGHINAMNAWPPPQRRHISKKTDRNSPCPRSTTPAITMSPSPGSPATLTTAFPCTASSWGRSPRTPGKTKLS